MKQQDEIRIFGIRTNNLKNIDVKIFKKGINLIIGPSGSGKSSLAYDTIAQIGQREYLSMFADGIFEPKYRVREYENMLAAVPIKQQNFNHNIRSSIGTYFGLSNHVALLYAATFGLNQEDFVLNRTQNLCPNCHGLGVTKSLDINKVLDFCVPICKNPFRPWNRYKDFYSQILMKYCLDCGIDSSKSAKELSENELNQLLYKESVKKYQIKFKKVNSISSRTTKFYGIFTQKPMIANFKLADKYFSDTTCPECGGRKYSKDKAEFKIFDLSIGEFMLLPFAKLALVLERLAQNKQEKSLLASIKSILEFVKMANAHNLGHLFLHRAIPTLSGGELQRLRMAQVFNTQLSELLIVLDEPLAGLSGNELSGVYDSIIALSQRHTVVVVDHTEQFVDVAKNIIALGRSGGKNGGDIIDYKDYLAKSRAIVKVTPKQAKDFFNISLRRKVYDYYGLDLTFAKGCLNLLKGNSGIGKSTILREYLPYCFDSYTYINQKPLMGNKNSSVATGLDIFTKIQDIFEMNFKAKKGMFSNLTGSLGACKICGGGGEISYGYDDEVKLTCSACGGSGFDKTLERYRIDGCSIIKLWDMPLDELVQFFANKNKTITSVLNNACELLLGHLKLGQSMSSLSGGENIRVKILKHSKKSSDVLGIDEPFRGLGAIEVHRVILFLHRFLEAGKTIIIAEHNEQAFGYFSQILNLRLQDGILTSDSYGIKNDYKE